LTPTRTSGGALSGSFAGQEDALVSSGQIATSATGGASSQIRAQGAAQLQSMNQAQAQVQAQALSQGSEAAAGGNEMNATDIDLAAAQSGQSLASAAGKVSAAGSGRSSAQAAAKVSGASSESVSRESALIAGQPAPSVQDAVIRDLTAVNTAGNAYERSGSSTAGHTGTTVSDTFAALDGETGAGTATWTHTGSQRVEAGYQDPTLGWVSVRADASGGSIHASLVPGSAAASEALGGHLAGLNSYLAEQHSPVSTVTLANSEDRWSGLDQSANQSMQQGSGQNPGQNGPSESSSSVQTSTAAITGTASSRVTASTASLDGATQTAVRPGGHHISVVA
jgi:hypothetical protein